MHAASAMHTQLTPFKKPPLLKGLHTSSHHQSPGSLLSLSIQQAKGALGGRGVIERNAVVHTQTRAAKAEEKTRPHAPPRWVPKALPGGPATTNALEKKKREATGSESCLRQGRATLQQFNNNAKVTESADLPRLYFVLPYPCNDNCKAHH